MIEEAWANGLAAWDVSAWTHVKQQIGRFVQDNWMNWVFVVLKVLVILIAGRLINSITRRAVKHMVLEREKSPLKFDPRRTRTIGKLIGNLVTYTVNFFVIILILYQFGFNLAPLLAGAGVIGLAIGFGAQSLVKDVITGFFIIFEDHFAVGDVIQTGNYKGTVEEIGIRVTRIRSWTGEVHIIPNGMITQVTNFSINNSLAVVDISVAYEADIEQATAVIKDTVLRVYEKSDLMVREPNVLGVQSVTNTEVTLRITAECRPNAQAEVTRLLNAEIKKALDEHGLKRIG